MLVIVVGQNPSLGRIHRWAESIVGQNLSLDGQIQMIGWWTMTGMPRARVAQ